MDLDFTPLRFVPLREQFLQRFEAMILSGRLRPGDRLPPERELATRMGVSRPVVHEGILELQSRGLVRIHSRLGTIVEDYRRSGSLGLLEALFRFQEGRLDAGWLRDALDFREMMEKEMARRAARCRTPEDLRALRELLAEEDRTPWEPARAEAWSDLDFRFHHALAMATGNRLFPMVVQSFRPAWRYLATTFFRQPGTVEAIRTGHRALVEAVARRRRGAAARAMAEMLSLGRKTLERWMEPAAGDSDG